MPPIGTKTTVGSALDGGVVFFIAFVCSTNFYQVAFVGAGDGFSVFIPFLV